MATVEACAKCQVRLLPISPTCGKCPVCGMIADYTAESKPSSTDANRGTPKPPPFRPNETPRTSSPSRSPSVQPATGQSALPAVVPTSTPSRSMPIRGRSNLPWILAIVGLCIFAVIGMGVLVIIMLSAGGDVGSGGSGGVGGLLGSILPGSKERRETEEDELRAKQLFDRSHHAGEPNDVHWESVPIYLALFGPENEAPFTQKEVTSREEAESLLPEIEARNNEVMFDLELEPEVCVVQDLVRIGTRSIAVFDIVVEGRDRRVTETYEVKHQEYGVTSITQPTGELTVDVELSSEKEAVRVGSVSSPL